MLVECKVAHSSAEAAWDCWRAKRGCLEVSPLGVDPTPTLYPDFVKHIMISTLVRYAQPQSVT